MDDTDEKKYLYTNPLEYIVRNSGTDNCWIVSRWSNRRRIVISYNIKWENGFYHDMGGGLKGDKHDSMERFLYYEILSEVNHNRCIAY